MDFQSIYDEVVSKLDYDLLWTEFYDVLKKHFNQPEEIIIKKKLQDDEGDGYDLELDSFDYFYTVQTLSNLDEFLRHRVICLEKLFLEVSALVKEKRLNKKELNSKMKGLIKSTVGEIELGDFHMSIRKSFYMVCDSKAELIFPSEFSHKLLKIALRKTYKPYQKYYNMIFDKLATYHLNGTLITNELTKEVCDKMEEEIKHYKGKKDLNAIFNSTKNRNPIWYDAYLEEAIKKQQQ